MRRYILPLLGALNLALLAVLTWLWVTPQGALRDVRWLAPQPVRPALVDAQALPAFNVDLSRYLATLERPLFTPSRRPPRVLETAASVPPPEPFPDIRLVGVYGMQGAGGVIAVVDGRVRRMQLGASIGDWSLKEVRSSEIVLGRGDDVRTIQLRRSTGTEPPLTAAGSAPASASPSGLPPAAEAVRQVEMERVRTQVRRMNVLRARAGKPLLPEP